VARIDGSHEAEAARELDLARVPEHPSVRAEDDRQRPRLDAESLEQGLRAGVAVGVERVVRMPVAREESCQPKHVAVAGVADDQRARDGALEETDAAQDERAHDAFAQLRFRDQNVAQLAGWDDERLDRLHGMRVHQRRAAGQLAELAHERARTVRDDRLVAPERVVLRDGDLTGQNDEHAGTDFAGRDEPLACAVGATLAEAPQTLNLRGLQGGEHLLVAGLDERARRRSHGVWRQYASFALRQAFPRPQRERARVASLPRAAVDRRLGASALDERRRTGPPRRDAPSRTSAAPWAPACPRSVRRQGSRRRGSSSGPRPTTGYRAASGSRRAPETRRGSREAPRTSAPSRGAAREDLHPRPGRAGAGAALPSEGSRPARPASRYSLPGGRTLARSRAHSRSRAPGSRTPSQTRGSGA